MTRLATVCINWWSWVAKRITTLEVDQTIVEGSDGLQVQVVGGLVQQQHIGAGQHHTGEHTAHLLAARQHLDRLERFIAGKEHTAQEAPEVALVVVGRILAEPLDEVEVTAIKELVVILGEIGLAGADTPLEAARSRLLLAR